MARSARLKPCDTEASTSRSSIRSLHDGSGPETMLCQASFECRNVYAEEARGSVAILVGTIEGSREHLPLDLGQHLRQRLTPLELLVQVDEAEFVGFVKGEMLA